MPDPFSGATGTTKQEVDILGKVNDRKKARSFGSNKKKEEKKPAVRVSELYNAGIALLKSRGFTVELEEGGDHINHRILKPAPPPMVKGIKYPHTFNPLQEISTDLDFEAIEAAFHPDVCEEAVREFWKAFGAERLAHGDQREVVGRCSIRGSKGAVAVKAP